MQDIEPFFGWRQFYTTEDDANSPYFEKEYSEFEYVDSIYNHYIHPQWDSIDSESLFVKVIFADYEEGYAFIELIGEWNDTLHNDIEYLKGNLLEILIDNGVNRIVLIGENVLNFHPSDDCYYEELEEELEGGYIMGINFQEHVIEEFKDAGLNRFIFMSQQFNLSNWRTFAPSVLIEILESKLNYRLI